MQTLDAATFESRFQIREQILFQIPFNQDDPNIGESHWSLTAPAKLAILLGYAQYTYLPSKGIRGWQALERPNLDHPNLVRRQNMEIPFVSKQHQNFSPKLDVSQTLQESLFIDKLFWFAFHTSPNLYFSLYVHLYLYLKACFQAMLQALTLE